VPRNDLATIARISRAEDLIALATEISEAVMFIAERSEVGKADEQELIRLLGIANRLKRIALDLRNEQGEKSHEQVEETRQEPQGGPRAGPCP
jgi:SepF-like predicted cell division protein (DUF552 family)